MTWMPTWPRPRSPPPTPGDSGKKYWHCGQQIQLSSLASTTNWCGGPAPPACPPPIQTGLPTSPLRIASTATIIEMKVVSSVMLSTVKSTTSVTHIDVGNGWLVQTTASQQQASATATLPASVSTLPSHRYTVMITPAELRWRAGREVQ